MNWLTQLHVDPATAARLLAPGHGALSAAIGRVRTVDVDSIGVVVAAERVTLPPLAFVVPPGDVFWSAVTRDPVPDPARRAFTFHFKPGLERAARLRRMTEVLGVGEDAFATVVERRTTLPSPGRDHADVVTAIDRALPGTGLAVTGNYFAGLAIEDCVARSKAEWARVTG